MDPLTVSAALSIASALGIDKAIGRWVGGDKGEAVAGRVLDAAQIVTGSSNKNEIIAALGADAMAASELKRRVLEIADAESQREFDDRANARAMQVAALGQDDKFSKRFVYYFATAWSLFAMSYLLLITLTTIPESSQRYADTTLGFLLGTIIATMIGYFYGSSRASQNKDSSITALAEAVHRN
jgi:hypothetical protein